MEQEIRPLISLPGGLQQIFRFALRSKLGVAIPCLMLSLHGFALDVTPATQRSVNDGQLILQDVPEIPSSLVGRLNQYQSMRSASFLDWGQDGKGLYVRTRFRDVSQIHYVFGPGGTRHQLTWLDDPVGQVERRGGSSELAYTLDQDGIENDQIYLVDHKTATTRLNVNKFISNLHSNAFHRANRQQALAIV